MKKNILLFTFALSVAFVSAQSIEFRKDSLGASVNGQLITVNGLNTDTEIIEELFVVQTSGSNMDIRAKSWELSIGAQIKHTLCWFACYIPVSPGVYDPFTSPDVLNISSGVPVNNFSAHYYPQGSTACSTFRYVLYDDNNPSDSAFVDVKFCTNPVSVNEINKESVKLNAFPNPATTNLTISYAIDANFDNAVIDVYDVLGQKVISKELNSDKGQVGLNVDALNAGVYFYAIKVDNQTIRTERVIVQ